MKVREGFILKDVGGRSVVVATGDACNYFQGMLTLNEMGKRMFVALKSETDEGRVADEIMEEYDVERYIVLSDLRNFVNKLRSVGIIEE